MSEKDILHTRQTVLQLAGVAIAGGSLAGCLDDGTSHNAAEPSNGDSTGDSDGNSTDPSNGADATDSDAAEETNDAEPVAEDSSDDERAETDDTTNTVGKTIDLEPGTDIRFSGQTVSWEGLSPAALEGAENPTLILQEGGRYSIGWTEGDGATHNLQICTDSGDVVNGLETPMVAEPGKDQILEFTASSEMTQYRCEPHQITMIGSIQVE